MFPAPSQIPTYNPSKPPKAPNAHKPGELAFVPPPSRLVPHQCSTLNTTIASTLGEHSGAGHESAHIPEAPSKPLTTLLLSLPLAQKIHYLILASRQIEGLARGWFFGSENKNDVERRMSVLEEQYDALRNEVECELESAWVNAGYLPAELPAYPPSRKTPGSNAVKPAIPKQGILEGNQNITNYTTDKALKRKPKEARHMANKKRKQSEECFNERENDDDMSYPLCVKPIGVTKAMERLKSWEINMLRSFNWAKAGRGRMGVRMRKVLWDECVSPKGTFTKYW